jgi:N-methylhydantoinase A
LSLTPVIDRADVGLDVIKGPVIVEAYDTTIVVPPDATITADRIGNLIIEVNHEN